MKDRVIRAIKFDTKTVEKILDRIEPDIEIEEIRVSTDRFGLTVLQYGERRFLLSHEAVQDLNAGTVTLRDILK